MGVGGNGVSFFVTNDPAEFIRWMPEVHRSLLTHFVGVVKLEVRVTKHGMPDTIFRYDPRYNPETNRVEEES